MKKFSLFAVSLALLALSIAFFNHPAQPQPVPDQTGISMVLPSPVEYQAPATQTVVTVAPSPVKVRYAQIFGGSGISGIMAFLAEYWQKISAVILAAATFIEVVVRITPTEKDNAWFSWLKSLLDKIIPNNKVGGGTHP